MPTLALQLARGGSGGAVLISPADYPARRPWLTRGTMRRVRRLPAGAALLVQPGDVVEGGAPIGRSMYAGRAAAVDLAAGLGITPGRDGGLERLLQRTAGDDVAEGEVLAERRTLGGLQRRTVKAPASGRLVHVSMDTDVAYLAPQPAAVETRAHLPGLVREVSDTAVVIEGDAIAIGARAGAGPAVSGTLMLAEDPAELPIQVAGGIVMVGFPLDEASARALVERGAVAIVALSAEAETIDRLGWDAALWPSSHARRAAGVHGAPSPPVTVLVLTYGSPPAELWATLRSLAGRPASALGREPGAAPELIVTTAAANEHEAPPATSGEPAVEDDALAPGQRVRVVAGRADGLTGEVVSVSARPYRLRSEVTTEVADVRFPYDVRLRVPLLHLQRAP